MGKSGSSAAKNPSRPRPSNATSRSPSSRGSSPSSGAGARASRRTRRVTSDGHRFSAMVASLCGITPAASPRRGRRACRPRGRHSETVGSRPDPFPVLRGEGGEVRAHAGQPPGVVLMPRVEVLWPERLGQEDAGERHRVVGHRPASIVCSKPKPNSSSFNRSWVMGPSAPPRDTRGSARNSCKPSPVRSICCRSQKQPGRHLRRRRVELWSAHDSNSPTFCVLTAKPIVRITLSRSSKPR